MFNHFLLKLEREMARLGAMQAADAAGASCSKSIAENVRMLEKAVFSVLDARARLARHVPEEGDAGLDLEGARAEILSRLARLAERGGAGAVS